MWEETDDLRTSVQMAKLRRHSRKLESLCVKVQCSSVALPDMEGDIMSVKVFHHCSWRLVHKLLCKTKSSVWSFHSLNKQEACKNCFTGNKHFLALVYITDYHSGMWVTLCECRGGVLLHSNCKTHQTPSDPINPAKDSSELGNADRKTESRPSSQETTPTKWSR